MTALALLLCCTTHRRSMAVVAKPLNLAATDADLRLRFLRIATYVVGLPAANTSSLRCLRSVMYHTVTQSHLLYWSIVVAYLQAFPRLGDVCTPGSIHDVQGWFLYHPSCRRNTVCDTWVLKQLLWPGNYVHPQLVAGQFCC